MAGSRHTQNHGGNAFRPHSHWVYLILQLSILLAIYLVYVGAVRLPLFSDDTVLLPAIKTRTLITLFENRPFGDGHHRPMSYVPWLFVRDMLGWFIHPILHMQTVWLHVLNTAFVGAIAHRLAHRLHLPAQGFALISSLIFGIFPLSYEAILWASALPHLIMTTFGLATVFVYVAAPKQLPTWARIIVCALLLLGACLSHETGFIFVILLLLVELACAYRAKRRIDAGTVVLTVLGLIYPVYYRFGLITKWNSGAASFASDGLGGIVTNAAYHAQSLLSWLLIPLRPLLGNPSTAAANAMLLIGLLSVLVATFAMLLRTHWWLPALVGLAWWVAAIAPSTVALDVNYVTGSPRLMYISVIGVALFWGACTAAVWEIWQAKTWRVAQAVLGAGIAALSIACVPYILARIEETARLKPMLTLLGNDVSASTPSDTFLYINFSFLNLPNTPLFLIGQEGLDTWGFTEPIGPMWTWAASVEGIQRDTDEVRIDALLTDRETNYGVPGLSFTRGSAGPFKYAVFGPVVDEIGLREHMLKANYIYRFDYDAPGFRMRRVGELHSTVVNSTTQMSAPPLARFEFNAARTMIQQATATTCATGSTDTRIIATLTWLNTSNMTEPTGIFVHGLNAAGQQVLVADYDLLDGALPLETMPTETAITETRELRAAEPVTELRIGIYNRADNKRFTALRDNNLLWEGEEIVVPVLPASATNMPAVSHC